MGWFQQFIAELKRRRVIRALIGWGIASFAVLQVYEPVMHGLHLPEWTLSFVVILLGAGFPTTAALAWVFDVSSSGVERTALVAPPSSTAAPVPSTRWLLALMLVAVASPPRRPALPTTSSLAVRAPSRLGQWSSAGSPCSLRWSGWAGH